MALFVTISWWLIGRGIQRRPSKIAFSLWAGTQLLFLLVGYSYLVGVTDTIGEFPAVAFSGTAQLAPDSCSILIGADDKQIALLIVKCEKPSETLQKYVLYVPRSEVKWMTVIRVVSIQPLARLDDLKRLSP
jgi:hypothetical protein